MARRRRARLDLPQRVYFRHGGYFFVDTAGKWHNLGRQHAEAMRRYAEVLTARVPLQTMGAIFDRYQREVVPKKAKRTQQDNLRELALLRQAFGHMHPHQVKPRHIYAYMDARQAPVRANREKALLSHVFRHAIQWGIVESNPCRFVSGASEKPRTRYVTDVEFWSVYELAPPAVACAMRLALLTGLRQGDVLRLRYSDYTDDGLEVTTSKTGKRLLFESTPELSAAVDEAKALRPAGKLVTHLVCTRDGLPYAGEGFKTAWQRVMRKHVAAGGSRFTFHDIRAKAGSDSEDERLLGHQDTRTLRRHYQRRPVKVTPLRPKILDSGRNIGQRGRAKGA